MTKRAHPLIIPVAFLYMLIMLAPILWMVVVSFTDPSDQSARPPGLIPQFSDKKPEPWHFRATLDNYRDFFGIPKVSPEDSELERQLAMQNAKDSRATFLLFLKNSVIVAISTTVLSVLLGSLAAYGFSRFKIAGAKDWLFFILSTRMLPALAVSLPISWMYFRIDKALGWDLLRGTPVGLVMLYTCFNLSFSTWMMKAFIDEIPKAYEEAALLDGYTRLQVLFKIILPQAMTGIMATAVFCLIAAWNEYAFSLTLMAPDSQTLPVFLAAKASITKTVYGQLAAGAILFMLPIVCFSLLMRKHLLRGITFGAVKG